MMTQELDIPRPAAVVPESLTGGDLPVKAAHRFRAIRQGLMASAEVMEVMALSWLPDEERWLYLVRTPSDWTWPRYVLGSVTEGLSEPVVLFRCGTPNTAWTEWTARNDGEHG